MKITKTHMYVGAAVVLTIIVLVVIMIRKRKNAEARNYPDMDYTIDATVSTVKSPKPPLKDGEGFEPNERLMYEGNSWTWTGSDWV
jgi:hypothetical protein